LVTVNCAEPFGLLDEPLTLENAPASVDVNWAISGPAVVVETASTKILTPLGMLLNTALTRVPKSAKPGVAVPLAAPDGYDRVLFTKPDSVLYGVKLAAFDKTFCCCAPVGVPQLAVAGPTEEQEADALSPANLFRNAVANCSV